MGGKSKKTRRDEERASPQIKIIIGSAIGTALYFLIVAIAAAAVLKSGTGSSAYLPQRRGGALCIRRRQDHPDELLRCHP